MPNYVLIMMLTPKNLRIISLGITLHSIIFAHVNDYKRLNETDRCCRCNEDIIILR